MSEIMPSADWPASYVEALLLIIFCLVVLFERGRTVSERLSVSMGAIRLGPPTLVALAEADTSAAVALLGGAIADYLAASEREPS